MPEEETRVEFNAPESLVHRADVLAGVLDISRTRLLVDALREEIDERLTDEGVQRRLRAAYYDGPVDFETVEALLGTEEAMRLQLLRASLDRDPPEPRIETTPPSREEFYSESPSVWAPDTAHPSERDGTDGE